MDSETIHLGLSDMLGSLHDGQTLDSVIREISDGKFEDTVAFEKQFIKGTAGADGAYTGDAESLDFCVTFLNYMLDLYNDEDMAYGGNGSILKDFDEDYDSPLDPEKTAESDLFKIVESNEYVDSTVDRWADGGKSLSGDPAYNEAQEANASAEAGEEGTSAPWTLTRRPPPKSRRTKLLSTPTRSTSPRCPKMELPAMMTGWRTPTFLNSTKATASRQTNRSRKQTSIRLRPLNSAQVLFSPPTWVL